MLVYTQIVLIILILDTSSLLPLLYRLHISSATGSLALYSDIYTQVMTHHSARQIYKMVKRNLEEAFVENCKYPYKKSKNTQLQIAVGDRVYIKNFLS